MSASGLVIMSCGPNAQANILPLPTLPDAITSVYNTHFTYTSHPKEMLLSSAFYPLPKALGNSLFYSLPENSGRAREGFKIPPSPALGRATSPLKGEVNQSYSGLTGVSRSDKTADSFNLDPRIRSEDDKLISEKQGENKLIQLASVCFVTDTNDCSGNRFANAEGEDNGHGAPGGNDADNGNQDDYELDNAERCKKEGYNKTSCLPGETAENFCLYDSNYFEKCVCPDGYKTCTPPYYGIGTACGNKYASCEKDTQRACKELNPNYTNTCGAGQQLSSDRCSYDSSYGTCCNTCAGYDNTTIPDGYVQDGEACVDCNGQPKYKIKPNPCDGFLDCGSMGPDTGATTCLSGTTTKYDNCKPCPNKGTLTSCPSPYTCTYEECSGRYYKSGCQSGYDWNGSTKTCTSPCPSNYRYTCSGTGYAGGYGSSCNGKYTRCYCSGNYSWTGSRCEIDCGYGNMWDGSSCVCDPSYYSYSCTGSHESPSGKSCNGKYEECSCSSGYSWFDGACNLCQNKQLPEGWTYDPSDCAYGTSDSESGSAEECYQTRYKCSACLLDQHQVGAPLESKGAIVDVTNIDKKNCSYDLTVVTGVKTGIRCRCDAQDIILHPQSLYRTIYNNLSKINAALSATRHQTISTDYPYRSSDTSYEKPNSEGFGGQHVFGSFNMATGQEEDSVVCMDGCGIDLGGNPDNHISNNLIIEEFHCKGERCR